MSTRTKDRESDYAMSAKRYAEQVVAGEILACRWVQRACQRQLDDLAVESHPKLIHFLGCSR